MNKLFVLGLVAVINLSGCNAVTEKEYSVQEVADAWSKTGPKAPLVVEIKAACHAYEDKGIKDSKVCNVLHAAQAEVSKRNLDLGANGGIKF